MYPVDIVDVTEVAGRRKCVIRANVLGISNISAQKPIIHLSLSLSLSLSLCVCLPDTFLAFSPGCHSDQSTSALPSQEGNVLEGGIGHITKIELRFYGIPYAALSHYIVGRDGRYMKMATQ